MNRLCIGLRLIHKQFSKIKFQVLTSDLRDYDYEDYRSERPQH